MLEYLFIAFIAPLELLMRVILEWGFVHTGSYGLSLILMSLIVNILLLPLYHLAETWQETERSVQTAMARQVSRIKAVFHGREKYYMLRTLYRQHNYHPIMAVRNSFGFLIQVPFFFAAYHLLSNYATMHGVSFWIFKDLALPDELVTIGNYRINILPFVMTIINIVSALVYTSRLTKNDKIQLYSVAAIFFIFLYASPSCLVFYWTCNNIFSLCKNIIYEHLHVFQHNKFKIKYIKRSNKHKIEFFKKIYHYCNKILFITSIISIIWIGFILSCGAESYQNYIIGHENIISCMIIFITFIYVFYFSICCYIRNLSSLYVVISITFGFIIIRLGVLHPFILIFVLAAFILITILVSDNIINRKIKIISHTISDKNLIKIYVSSNLLLLLSIFIYTPVLLMQSSSEFFNKNVIYFLTQSFIIVTYCMFVSFYTVNKKFKTLLVIIISCLAILSFIYNNIIIIDYGIIDMPIFQHNNKIVQSWYIFIDSALFAIILLFVFYCFLYNYKLITTVFSILIFTLSSITAYNCYSLIRSNSIKKTDIGLKYDNCSKNSYDIEVSLKGNNIFIFMLDSFTGDHLELILKDKPFLYNNLDGFVFYNDTISTGIRTVLSVPSIIGGENLAPYNLQLPGETLENRIKSEIKVFFDKLENNKISPIIISMGKVDFIDDEKYVSHANYDYIEIDRTQMYNVFTIEYSIFKSLPLSARQIIYRNGLWIFLDRQFGTSIKNYQFLDDLSSNTRISKNDIGKYIFIDCCLTHFPWSIDKDTLRPIRDDEESTSLKIINDAIPRHLYSETAAMLLLNNYFSWLKEHNLYDSACIIIVSDHDDADSLPLARTFGVQTPTMHGRSYPGRPNALLMVKLPRSHGPLRIDSTPMATCDVRNIVESSLDGKQWRPPHNRIRFHAIGDWQRGRHPRDHFRLDSLWQIRGNKLVREHWQQVPVEKNK